MVSPMLLKEISYTDNVFDGFKDWYWQEKHNGERALIHISGSVVAAIRNRNDNPVKQNFPEVSAIKFSGIDNAVIDCEMVVMDAGNKSIFYGGINQRRAVPSKDRLVSYPVRAVAFDILYLNGQSLLSLPYSERLSILNNNFLKFAGSSLSIIENIDNPKEYWEKVLRENREGLVLKNPAAHYYPGKRMPCQLKLKYYKRSNVLVESIEPNPKGVKIIGKTPDGIHGEIQWSSSGFENIKVGDSVPVEYLDVVNNNMVQPHKIKGVVIDEV